MAASYKLLSVVRPKQFGAGAGGGPGDLEDCDFLEVTLDRFSNGVQSVQVTLAFADYAGLETEWTTGTATTVLDAAIDTALAAVSEDFDDPVLTSAQRALMGTEYPQIY